MKKTLSISIRILALSVFYFICFSAVAAALLQTPSEQPASASGALAGLVAISVLNSLVLGYIILRARWAGWKLIFAIFVVLYGVTTVMSQIETAFFITRLPPGMLPRLFLAGAIISALISTLAVLILGKRRANLNESDGHSLNMSGGQWAFKLTLIAIAYLVLYFSFGYFIAWKNPAVREYYGGGDPGTLLDQMKSVVRDQPLLLPLQVVRAILWTAIAVPVIRMMKGQWWEAGLAVALLFSVVMNTQLLIPNPFMPEEVRMTHLVETATSNFLFGWLIVLVLLRWNQSARAADFSKTSRTVTLQ